MTQDRLDTRQFNRPRDLRPDQPQARRVLSYGMGDCAYRVHALAREYAGQPRLSFSLGKNFR